MKLLAKLLVFLLAATASAQDRITYTTTCVPLQTAVDAIGRQSGKKLIVSEELSSEPIVLRLKDVPVQDVLDRIGTEFVAQWTQTKDGLKLERTPAVVDPFEKALAQRRLAAIQKSLDELKPILQSQPMDDNEAHRIAATYVKMLSDEKTGSSPNEGTSMRFSLGNRTADMRLLASMALAIGAEKLSSLPPGRHVFSLDPTPVEERIEGVNPQIIDQYVAQRNMLANAINAIKPKDVYDGYGDSPMYAATHTAKTPIRPLLEVQTDPKGEGAWLRLSVFDGEDKNVISLGWPIGNTYNPRKYVIDRAKTNATSKNEADIALSPVEMELALRARNHSGEIKPLTTDARNALSHPEDKEILEQIFSQVLLSQAEQENRNLVASAADTDWRIPRLVGKNELKPSIFELSMTTFRSVAYDRPDGWLIVHSVNPISATEKRVPRDALGGFSRAFFDKGYVTVEDWAEFATHVQPRDEPGIFWQYWDLMRGQNGESYVNDWDTLRLYGMLSDDQLHQLSSGQGLPYHTLSSEQQETLDRIVYESQGVRKRTNPADPHAQTMYLDGVEGEPFESVPNGIPPNASLTAATDTQDSLYIKWGDEPVERASSIGEVASMLVQDQDGPPRGPDDSFRVQTVRVGTKRTITFHLLLSDKLESESELREDQFPNGDPIPVKDLKDRLPPDVWKKLQGQMEAMRKVRKNFHVGPPENNPPPAAPPFRS